ncbi:2,3-diaminopropionate biosynthesis protein SbnB [Bacillus weihaiensis]|uniref:2,3-diaminopropionate biosynthesis protein SbnB n=1 Tax=Bacillus weihaiensis TaxID=1547283 RepID=UPI00235585EC|nr:2,3-diaminopropionate biosynthesis protein SbnB [Bacillus weihaiensis]
MLYLNEEHFRTIGNEWSRSISIISNALKCYGNKDYSQPVKPYLRYKNMTNRIIAMPAYLGGKFDIAGIKWISSFPENINKNKSRANSVVILNDANTGEPISILNGTFVSIIRTVSLSGLIIEEYLKKRKKEKVVVGIIGFGPIGQYHSMLLQQHFQEYINNILVYDKRPIAKEKLNEKIQIVNKWEDAYLNSDIVITCTVSEKRYIDKAPKPGSLLLNISLRDFKAQSININNDLIVVDDWDEVARENTDIEYFSSKCGLSKEKSLSLYDLLFREGFTNSQEESSIMVNPMGLAVFDVAIANYYYNQALDMNVGIKLS